MTWRLQYNPQIKGVNWLFGIKMVLNPKENDQKTIEYIHINNPQPWRFYLLPKLHKRVSQVPSRLVISNNGNITKMLVNLLTSILEKIISLILHILERTRGFLSLVKYIENKNKNEFHNLLTLLVYIKKHRILTD